MTDFKDVEWLARTADVQVRVNTLAPHASTPWHYHSEVKDDLFGLEHGLEVGLRDPEEVLSLAPGTRVQIVPRRVHRVANTTAHPVRYLLVQATGRYDFNAVS